MDQTRLEVAVFKDAACTRNVGHVVNGFENLAAARRRFRAFGEDHAVGRPLSHDRPPVLVDMPLLLSVVPFADECSWWSAISRFALDQGPEAITELRPERQNPLMIAGARSWVRRLLYFKDEKIRTIRPAMVHDNIRHHKGPALCVPEIRALLRKAQYLGRASVSVVFNVN